MTTAPPQVNGHTGPGTLVPMRLPEHGPVSGWPQDDPGQPRTAPDDPGPRRRYPWPLIVIAAPAAVAVGAAAAANWDATYAAVTSQPNFPEINHPTPWASLSPHMADGVIAAGPARIVAILVACGCAVAAGRRWRAARGTEWDAGTLRDVLWWAAFALALRCAFEPVVVAYYLWPALAVALVVASETWSRLIAAGIVATVLTFVSQASWHGVWIWWAPMMALLALTLLLARVPLPWRRLVPGSSSGLGVGALGYFDGDRGDEAERAGDAG